MSDSASFPRPRRAAEIAVAALVVVVAATALLTLRAPDAGDGSPPPPSTADGTAEPGGPAVPCTGAMCGEDTGSEDCRGEMCGDVGSEEPCGDACGRNDRAPLEEPCPTDDPMCGRLSPEDLGPADGDA